MNSRVSTFLFLCLLMAPLVTIQAEDINVGKELHQENCLECHKSELYERTDRTVKTLKHLRSQVLFCAVNNDVGWFDEEIDDVTAYLNTFYYLFDMK
ncbi:MAG: cytochrome c [Proteobacteria bacterium]|nr:cytochrome c [Pseudomonadota bacterium]